MLDKQRRLKSVDLVRNAGAESCYSVVFEKEWRPVRGMPPCVGAACLGNSKVRWYTMLEAGISKSMVPLTGDTDSIIFASPRGVTLDDWRMQDTSDPLYPEFKDGIMHDSRFGKASDDMASNRVFACLALLAKFYTLLVGEGGKAGAPKTELPSTLLMSNHFPQTTGQWRDALEAVEGGRARDEMLEGPPTQGECDEIKAYDARALATWWASNRPRVASFDRGEVERVVAQCDMTIHYPYTKLKALRLAGNETSLHYLRMRRLLFDQLEHTASVVLQRAARLSGGEGAPPHLSLDRPQLQKRRNDLKFISAKSVATAAYDTRLVQAAQPPVGERGTTAQYG